jgi:hypothetical protein
MSAAAGNMVYRSMVIALIAFIGLAMLFGLLLVITDGNEAAARLCGSSAIGVLGMGAIIAAETARRKKRIPITMALSMLCTALGSLGMIVMFICEESIESESREQYWTVASSALAVGVMLAHCGSFSLVRTKSWLLLLVKIAVMACVWLAGLTLVAVMWLELIGNGAMQFFFWSLSVIGFLGLASIIGTITVPLAAVSRANRDDLPNESVHTNVRITLTCPKCGYRQEMRAGNARCTSCGTGVFIEVEEPRCVCGYLIYQLQGDTCPECGRPVANVRRRSDDPDPLSAS